MGSYKNPTAHTNRVNCKKPNDLDLYEFVSFVECNIILAIIVFALMRGKIGP